MEEQHQSFSSNNNLAQSHAMRTTEVQTCPTILDFSSKYCSILAPSITPFSSKWISMYLPNRLELSFLTVLALPNATNDETFISLQTGDENKKLSYRRRTAAQLYKIIFEKACSRWMTLKVTQGHRKCRYLIGHIHISLPVNDLSTLWLWLMSLQACVSFFPALCTFLLFFALSCNSVFVAFRVYLQ